MTKEDLIKTLKNHKTAPFLFLGSGFSRHYLNSPTWKELLVKFSPKHINQYYSTLNTQDLSIVASAIAKDITYDFWNLNDNDEAKKKYQDKVTNTDSLLKIKISEFLDTFQINAIPSNYDEELNLLKNLKIDGVITTNWDTLAESIFDKFTTFIGQRELILSSTLNMGEIYKIHGCITKPNSMVLTDNDYKEFKDRNPYLSAKLITLFMEHPIVFMGYSMNDNNIIEILQSIVTYMDQNALDKIQNNLIFVEWIPDDLPDIQIEKHEITLGQGKILPVTRIITHEYKPVYNCLAYYERGIPTHLLRKYKDAFYNIVISENPEKNILVLPENKIDDNPNIQVVYGFGAVTKYQSAIGYIGIKPIDIYRDVVDDDKNYDPKQMLSNTIPDIIRRNRKIYIPIYKYLHKINIRNKNDYNKHKSSLNGIPIRKLRDFQGYDHITSEYKNKTLEELLSTSNLETWKKVAFIPYLTIQDEDLPKLKTFISNHINEFLVNSNNTAHSTFMRKLICFYDWRKYGWK